MWRPLTYDILLMKTRGPRLHAKEVVKSVFPSGRPVVGTPYRPGSAPVARSAEVRFVWPVKSVPAIAVPVTKPVEIPFAHTPVPSPPPAVKTPQASSPPPSPPTILRPPDSPSPSPFAPSSVKHSCGYNPFFPPGGQKNLSAFQRVPFPDFRPALISVPPTELPGSPLLQPRPTGGGAVPSFG
jgi:hypothetical protein